MIEFSLPWSVISPLGTYDDIDGETDGSQMWRIVADGCAAGADLRVNDQDLPQTDGAELHPHFRSGYKLKLAMQPFDGGSIAVADTRREMWEDLSAHLEAIRNADGRIQWTPSGSVGDRILDSVRLVERADASGGLLKTVTFTVVSRFPYYLAATQEIVELPEAALDNDGSAPFKPVVKVHGPVTTGFTITSNTDLDLDGNPKQVIYDTSLPGAATIDADHYAEIDFFRSTIVLKDDDDVAIGYLSAGIDWASSDFFSILAGTNDVDFDGDGTPTLLFNAAFS